MIGRLEIWQRILILVALGIAAGVVTLQNLRAPDPQPIARRSEPGQSPLLGSGDAASTVD
jgi:hypothetical protein